MPRSSTTRVIPVESIARSILVLRSHKVLLDAELAELYGVTTRRLNEQVRRNRKRFPDDFLFELTAAESAGSFRSPSPNMVRSWPPRFSTAHVPSR